MYDILIVGGGPAGLSAALVLARCRRHVLVCDSGHPRNAVAESMHGFLTRDGMTPLAFLRVAREQLARYDVEFRSDEVVDLAGEPGAFEAALAGGDRVQARRVLLATGVVDRLPGIEGFDRLYGTSIHHCPYCDGWEERDRAIAVYGRAHAGCELSLSLLTWSADVVLCTDGPSRLAARDRARLDEHGIEVREAHIARLEGTGGRLARVVFDDGSALEREAMFFTTGQYQRSTLARKLQCRFTNRGSIWVGDSECSSVPGVYVAGDASHEAQLVIVAAAEGAKAAVAINHELQRSDLAGAERAQAHVAPEARTGIEAHEPEGPGGP